MSLSEWDEDPELPSADDPERSRCRAIRCLDGEIAPFVLLPGDPGRARMISRNFLSECRLVMRNREFHSYTGTFRDLPVSVISTGLGSPGAAMVISDLARLGVKAVIRVGTAGSGQQRIAPGGLVIATGAIRDEGVSSHYVGHGFPAVSDPVLSQKLAAAAQKLHIDEVHRGIVHTSDAFKSPMIRDQVDRLAEADVLAYEMEAAAIFVLSTLNKIAAACILAIDGRVREVQSGNTLPDFQARDKGIENMITIALNALLSYRQMEKDEF